MVLCAYVIGERMILTVQDNTFSQQPAIFCYNLSDDIAERMNTPPCPHETIAIVD
jgi:hypothetical protein